MNEPLVLAKIVNAPRDSLAPRNFYCERTHDAKLGEVSTRASVSVGENMAMFIRMRRVEIGEKLQKLFNQRLRIDPPHQNNFSVFGCPGTNSLEGSGSWEDFDGFCEFLQFLSTFLGN